MDGRGSPSVSTGMLDGAIFSNAASAADIEQNKLAKRRIIPNFEKMFPVLSQLDMVPDWKLTVLGVILEIIQYIGLTLNPHFQWGPGMGSIISKVVYFFDFPLYDSEWAPNTFIPANVFFAVFNVMMLVWLMLLAWYTTQDFQKMPNAVRATCKLFAHCITSFGTLPIGMLVASFTVCESGQDNMFWYKKEKCWAGFGGYGLAFGIVGLVLLALVLYISGAFIFEDAPDSDAMSARPDPMITGTTLATKYIAIVLFHVLLSYGYAQVFAATMSALFGLQAILYIVFLPYYSLRMNQFRAAQMLGVACFTAVAALDIPEDMLWHRKSISTIVGVGLLVVGFIVGWVLGMVRVNHQCIENLDNPQARRSHDHEDYIFPTCLPENDLVFSRYPNIEAVVRGQTVTTNRAQQSANPSNRRNVFIIEEGEDGRGHNHSDDDDDRPAAHAAEEDAEAGAVLDPYIMKVFLPSDVEVATRFMREYALRSCSAAEPTPRMCALTARIYTKGMVKFRNDDALVFQFCVFLATYAKRLRLALAEITKMQGEEYQSRTSLPLKYRMFRLSENLKKSLNVSNTHQIQLVSISSELHKDILSAIASFWRHLVSGNQNSSQLAQIADYITAKREHCKKFYDKSLQTPNELILIHYSQFLRDVMLDSESAEVLRERVAEEAELYRQQRRRQHEGSHKGSSNNHSRLGANWNSCKLVLQTSGGNKAADSYGDGKKFHQGVNEIMQLRAVVYGGCALVAALAIGLIIFVCARVSILQVMVNRISAASDARLYTTVGAVIASQVEYIYSMGTPTPEMAAALGILKQEVARSAGLVLDAHTDLTLGKLYSGDPLVSDFLNAKRTEIIEPGVWSIEGDQKRVLTDLFNLGFRIASQLTEISSSATPPAAALRFIQVNTDEGTFARALNHSVNLYIEQRNVYLHNTVWVIVVFVSVAIVVLIGMYCMVQVYLRRIAVNKVSTINLFSLIPRSYLQEFYQASREKIRTFDKEDDVEYSKGGSKSKRANNGSSTPSSDESSSNGDSNDLEMNRDEEDNAHQAHASLMKKAVAVDDDADEQQVDERCDDDVEFLAQQQHSMWNFFTATKQLLSRPTVIISFIFIGTLLAIAACGMTYQLFIVTKDFHEEASYRNAHYQLSWLYYNYMSSLGASAQQYVLTGDTTHVERYYETMLDIDVEQLFSVGEIDETETASVQAIVNIKSVVNSALLRQQVAMWLASTVYGIPDDNINIFSRVFAVEREYNFPAMNAADDALFMAYYPVIVPSATTPAVDAALTDAQKTEISRNLVYDDIYAYHRYVIAKYIGDLGRTHSDKYSELKKKQDIMWLGSLILQCVMILSLIVVLVGYYFQRSSMWTRAGPIVALGLLIIGIALLIATKKALWRASDVDTHYIRFLNAANETNIKLDANKEYAMRMAIYGYPSTQTQWETTCGKDAYYSTVISFLSSYMEGVEPSKTRVLSQSAINLIESIEHRLFYTDITAFLSGVAYTLPPSENLLNFNYNREFGFRYEEEYMKFGNHPFYYSSSEEDTQKPAADMLTIAEATIASQRHEFLIGESDKVIARGIGFIGKSIVDERELLFKDTDRYTESVFIFCAVLLGVMVLSFVYSLYRALMQQSSAGTIHGNSSGANKHTALSAARKLPVEDSEKKKSDDGKDSLATSNRRQIVQVVLFFSILLVILMFGGLLAIGVYLNSYEVHNSELLGTIKGRDWSLIQSLVQAQRIWNSSPDNQAVSPYLLNLIRSLAEGLTWRQNLYLGDGSFGGLLRSYADQDKDLFGSPEFKWAEYQQCSTFEYEKGYAILDFEPADAFNENMFKRLFSQGTENVVWQLLGLFTTMIKAKSVEVTEHFRNSFLLVLGHLSDRLHDSSADYFDARGKSGNAYLAIFVVIAVLLLIILGLLLLLVFRPLLLHLEDEEEGTRLLLRMIPENVRRDVPAINDFFQTGSVNRDCDIINAACEEEQNTAIVVVSSDDTILYATQETLRRFQRSESELVGEKVDILLSDERAVVISGYRKQFGVSRLSVLAGKQVRSVGQRMDGTRFPMELFIREVFGADDKTRGASSSIFVVRVNIVGIKYDVEMVRRFQRSTFDSSPQPQVVTDQLGTIRMINNATLKMLGYDRDDLIGKNVSLIMPTQIALAHDRYLERFVEQSNKLREGFSSSRRVTAKTKSNGELHIDVQVTAVLDSVNPAAPATVGFLVSHLRDATNDIEEMNIDAVTKSLIEVSPVPIVIFDTSSIIVAFSPAAERSWSCKSEDVIGLPVHTLLYGADATSYDFTYGPKSGLKHFLDTSRSLEAKRSNGDHFLVEVSMRELRNADSLTILAYFKDLSREHTISQRNLASQYTFDCCPIPIVVSDEEGTIITVNPATVRQFGHTLTDIIGKNVSILMPDHIARKHDDFLQRYMETGIKTMLNSTRQEYAKRADGRLFTVEIRARELYVDTPESDGKRRLFVAYLRDTSEEYQMRRANDLHGAITDRCPVPIVSIDRHGTILSFNPAAEDFFNYEAHSVVGNNVKMLMPDRFALNHDKYLANYFLTGKRKMVGNTTEVFARLATGQEVPVEIKVRKIQKDLVDPIFVASLTDISVKAQLEDAEEVERAFISTYPVSIVVINGRGTIRFFSHQAIKLFGFPADSSGPLGSHISTLINRYDDEEEAFLLPTLLMLDDPSRPSQQRQCSRMDRTAFSARVSITKMSAIDGPVVSPVDQKERNDAEDRFIVFVQDLTTESTLKQSGSVKDHLLNDVLKIAAVEIDGNGIISYVNDGFLTTFGYKDRKACIHKNISIIMSDKDVASGHTGAVQNYLSSAKPSFCLAGTQELDAVRADGSIVRVELTVSEIVDDKQVFSFLGLIRDINDTVRIRNRQKLMKDILMTSPLSAFLVTYNSPLNKEDDATGNREMQQEGVIYAMNPAALTQFKSSGELVGQGIHTVVTQTHTSPIEEYRRQSNAKTAHGSKGVMDHALSVMGIGVKRDGSTFPARLSLTGFFDAEENKWSLIAFVEETTVKELLQLEHRLSQTVSSITPSAMVCADEDGRIVLFSNQAEELFNTSEKDMLDQPITSIMVPQTATVYLNLIGDYMRSSDRHLQVQSKTLYRQVAMRPDKTIFPAEITVYEASGDMKLRSTSSSSSSEPRLFVYHIRDTSTVTVDAITGNTSKAAMSTVGLPFMLLNEVGVMKLVNDSLAKLVGCTQDELLGRNVKVLLPPDVARKIGDTLQQMKDKAAAAATSESGEASAASSSASRVMYIPVKHKDGHVLSVELNLSHHYSKEMSRIAFHAFLRDIGELIELKKEEALNEVLADAEGVGVVLMDANGDITYASITAHDMFGYNVNSDKLEGRSLGTIIPRAKSADTISDWFQNGHYAQEDSAVKFVELRVEGRCHDGAALVCNLQLREATQNSTDVSYLGMIKDLPRHTAAGDNLLMLQEVERLSLIGVVCVNGDSIINYVNHRAARIFGYSSPNELVGKNLNVLLPPSEAKDHHLYLENYVKGFKGRSVVGLTRRLAGVRKDRTTVTIHLTLEEYKSAAHGHQFISYVEDLTTTSKTESEKASQAVLAFIPVITFLVADDGSILQVSHKAADTLRTRKEAILGQQISQFLTEANSGVGVRVSQPGTYSVTMRTAMGNVHRANLHVTELTGVDVGRTFLCMVLNLE